MYNFASVINNVKIMTNPNPNNRRRRRKPADGKKPVKWSLRAKIALLLWALAIVSYVVFLIFNAFGVYDVAGRSLFVAAVSAGIAGPLSFLCLPTY